MPARQRTRALERFGRRLLYQTGLACLLMTAAGAAPARDGLIWAVNIGGPACIGVDGVTYAAEEYVRGGQSRRLQAVKGSQDPLLYRDYRAGDVRISRSLENGPYDLTLYFAEPEDLPGGARVFDVFAEGRRIIADLDIMAFRDGKVRSALTITVPNVWVADGRLDIDFAASAGEPVVSALAVRRRLPPDPAWQLTWADEFDDRDLDSRKWTAEEWPARKVNDEDQAYTARRKNLRLADGRLIIEAHREDYANAEYTSARIHSAGNGDFLYGRFEVRAQLPRGKGSWPAIWMLPSDPFRYASQCNEGEWQGNAGCDAWPNSGEIDIMEHVGYQMGHVHSTVHNKAYYWVTWEQRKGRILLDDVDRAFHVYALEWTPERIDAYVDDTLYFSYVNEQRGWQSWPYDHPFHLVLNLAVGGMWGRAGGGIDASVFPQRLLVDYVRVYRRSLASTVERAVPANGAGGSSPRTGCRVSAP